MSFAKLVREGYSEGRGSAAKLNRMLWLRDTRGDPRAGLCCRALHFQGTQRAPDIDVDFEHERREEEIQYIYGSTAASGAALAATVICYRPRRASGVGKHLGLDLAPGRQARAALPGACNVGWAAPSILLASAASGFVPKIP